MWPESHPGPQKKPSGCKNFRFPLHSQYLFSSIKTLIFNCLKKFWNESLHPNDAYLHSQYSCS